MPYKSIDTHGSGPPAQYFEPDPATVEACAKVADRYRDSLDNAHNRALGLAQDLVETCDDIAAEIRSLVPAGIKPGPSEAIPSGYADYTPVTVRARTVAKQDLAPAEAVSEAIQSDKRIDSFISYSSSRPRAEPEATAWDHGAREGFAYALRLSPSHPVAGLTDEERQCIDAIQHYAGEYATPKTVLYLIAIIDRLSSSPENVSAKELSGYICWASGSSLHSERSNYIARALLSQFNIGRK